MKRNGLILYSVVFTLLLLAGGCKTSKKATSGGSISPKAQSEFFNDLLDASFKFNTLTARMNIDLNLPGKSIGSRVDLKMVKDEAFQLSIQPLLGIEMFRAEISVDSIKILDRMNKRYVAESFASLKGSLPIDFNFYNLQALFANHLFYPGEQAITPKLFKKFELKQDAGNAKAITKDALDLIYIFSTDREQKLINTHITDDSEQYSVQWAYTDFRLVDKQPFPMVMDILLSGSGKELGGATFRFAKVETDKPLTLEFVVPSKYKHVSFTEIIKSISSNKK